MLPQLLTRHHLTALAAAYEARVLARLRLVRERRGIGARALYDQVGVNAYLLARQRRRLTLRAAVEAAHLLRVPPYLLLAQPGLDLSVEVADMLAATQPPDVEVVDGRTAEWRVQGAMHAGRMERRTSCRVAEEYSGVSKSVWGRLKTRDGPIQLCRMHAGCAAFGVDFLAEMYNKRLGRAPLQEG